MVAAVEFDKKRKKEKLFTFEEYLKKEEKAVDKNEFYKGQILKMPGAKYRHNQVASNMIYALIQATNDLKTPYHVLNSDQKIYIEQEDVSVYPDALVICEVPIFWQGREDIIVNPLVVVEVSSRSTSSFDRTTKFWWYKNLESFKEYVVIDPDKALVETWFKQDESTWITTNKNDISEIFLLKSIGISISLSDVYRKVDFPEKPVKK